MSGLLTQADYARHRGCTPPTVFRAIKSGRISTINGKIDPVTADREWDANTDHQKRENAQARIMQGKEDAALIAGEEPTQSNGDTYLAWKTRRERAEALRSELAYAQSAGELYEKADADRAAKTMARLLRDRLFGIPVRVSAELAGLTDPAAIEALLHRELRTALSAIEREALAESDVS